MVGVSLFNRTVGFETRRWGRFEWRYGNKRERAQYSAVNLLILEKVEVGGGRRVRVAQLVRNNDLRTPGTKRCTGGNGGRLQMDLGGEKGQQIIEEVVVVVTCLVMLKKEIDILFPIQIGGCKGMVM